MISKIKKSLFSLNLILLVFAFTSCTDQTDLSSSPSNEVETAQVNLQQKEVGDTLSPPSNIRVSSSNASQITLEWSPVDNADGYIIYKKDNNSGNYSEIDRVVKIGSEPNGIKIHYKGSKTHIHFKKDDESWTSVPGVLMEDSSLGSDYKYYFVEGADKVVACFNNNGSSWDNNNRQNYTIRGKGEYKIKSGSITSISTPVTYSVSSGSTVASGIKIHYKGSKTHIHYNKDDQGWTSVPGALMGDSYLGDDYKYYFIENANSVEACFNRNGSSWDNNNRDNYNINGQGEYKIVNGSVTIMNSGPAYTDSNLNSDTTYLYKIRSYNAIEESVDSNVISASTTGPDQFDPYIGPYLTLISYDDNDVVCLNPENSMVVSYETEESPLAVAGKVQYRVQGSSTWSEMESTNLSKTIHHVELSGLTAGTVYEYRVLDYLSNVSATYRFKTAPSNVTQFKYVIMGDMQDQQAINPNTPQRWDEVANDIYDNHNNEVDFLLIVGDMPNEDMESNSDRYANWKVFFDKGKNIFATKPMMPIMGNHDDPANNSLTSADRDSNLFFGTYSQSPHSLSDLRREWWSNAEDTSSFRKYFNIPSDSRYKTYYSFTYGNSYFICINSEINTFYGYYPNRSGAGRVTEQNNWVVNELNTAQSYQWRFATMHVPPINPAGGKRESETVRHYTEYFNNSLDWCFTGHVHIYQRMKPIITYNNGSSYNVKSKYRTGTDRGVGYMITPPAGHWPRTGSTSYLHAEESATNKEVGYVLAEVDNGRFAFKTYLFGGVDNNNHGKIEFDSYDSNQE